MTTTNNGDVELVLEPIITSELLKQRLIEIVTTGIAEGSPSDLSALVSSSGDSADPIGELLAQLSGERHRPATNAASSEDTLPQISQRHVQHRHIRQGYTQVHAQQDRAQQERAQRERAQQEREQQQRAQQERAQQEHAQQERAQLERAQQERAQQRQVHQDYIRRLHLQNLQLRRQQVQQDELQREQMELLQMQHLQLQQVQMQLQLEREQHNMLRQRLGLPNLQRPSMLAANLTQVLTKTLLEPGNSSVPSEPSTADNESNELLFITPQSVPTPPSQDSQFLLPRVLEDDEHDQEITEEVRAERSIFVQQLLLSTIAEREDSSTSATRTRRTHEIHHHPNGTLGQDASEQDDPSQTTSKSAI